MLYICIGASVDYYCHNDGCTQNCTMRQRLQVCIVQGHKQHWDSNSSLKVQTQWRLPLELT